MNINSFINTARSQLNDQQRDEIRKEQSATDFEEIFARHLVKELTKDSFQMTDNTGGVGSQSSLYREFITDALAGELATQRKLGMADLIMKYWDQQSGSSNENS